MRSHHELRPNRISRHEYIGPLEKADRADKIIVHILMLAVTVAEGVEAAGPDVA